MAHDDAGPGRPSERAPRIAAVVVNFRTAADTVACVRALERSHRPFDEVVVVDNGSGDGSEQTLREALAGATLLASSVNLGFSGGVNLAIRHALERGIDQILLVNSDAMVPPDCVERLSAALAADRRLGVVGPALLSRSGPPRVLSTGIQYSTTTGRMTNRDAGQTPGRLPRDARRRITGISGCAMLIRREVFAAIGLFDEAYFFYFEDLDFCLRASAAGFEIACVGDAEVFHEGAASIGATSARRIYFATRNHLLLAGRAAPTGSRGTAVLRGCAVVGFNLAHVLFTAGTPVLPGLRALARGVADHLRGRYGDAR